MLDNHTLFLSSILSPTLLHKLFPTFYPNLQYFLSLLLSADDPVFNFSKKTGAIIKISTNFHHHIYPPTNICTYRCCLSNCYSRWTLSSLPFKVNPSIYVINSSVLCKNITLITLSSLSYITSFPPSYSIIPISIKICSLSRLQNIISLELTSLLCLSVTTPL